MLRILRVQARALLKSSDLSRTRRLSSVPPPKDLRILYCGSDDFSAVSLRKLNDVYCDASSSVIKSLEVVVKAGKPSGRGLKTTRDVPIKKSAGKLGLTCHEINTFTGWSPPSPVDLVIAVSFGLKVPSRILRGAKYGGLNLHPSLLPDLRGPAPLQHALLQGREHTGITLQTLHPEHFDLGEIVAQRQFQIQRPNKCTLHDLYDQASTVAAQALVESIVSGSYLDHTPQPSISDANVTHARKLTPEVAHVDWETWPIDRVLRTGRVFGHVWCYFDSKKHGEVRVQMHGLQQCYAPVGDEAHSRGVSKVINGAATNGDSHQSPNMRLKISGDIVTVATCDGNLVSCDTVTAEGRPKHEDAVDFFTALGQDRV